jgi:hypothetical protein
MLALRCLEHEEARRRGVGRKHSIEPSEAARLARATSPAPCLKFNSEQPNARHHPPAHNRGVLQAYG